MSDIISRLIRKDSGVVSKSIYNALKDRHAAQAVAGHTHEVRSVTAKGTISKVGGSTHPDAASAKAKAEYMVKLNPGAQFAHGPIGGPHEIVGDAGPRKVDLVLAADRASKAADKHGGESYRGGHEKASELHGKAAAAQTAAAEEGKTLGRSTVSYHESKAAGHLAKAAEHRSRSGGAGHHGEGPNGPY